MSQEKLWSVNNLQQSAERRALQIKEKMEEGKGKS